MKLKKDQKAKAGKAAKDIVPATIGKPPREPQPIRFPDAPDSSYPFEIQPSALSPPWPGDSAASSFNFNLESTTLFEDGFEYCFPKSMVTDEEVLWKWPEEFVEENEILSRVTKRRASVVMFEPSSVEYDPDAAFDPSLRIVSTYERDELPEEYEKRKQEETEKWIANKKKGKNPADDLPAKKVKDVILERIEMGKRLPSFPTWLSSQLSILRDRDWKNHDGVYFWRRIYPQVDGIPVYNKSGKYWVKLLFLGQERLVEVDGRMPCSQKWGLMMPRSYIIRDMWPMILAKAFLKLTTPVWKNVNKYITDPNQELDGSFIYSLTGLLPQHYSLSEITKQEWSLLKSLLSDDSWSNRTSIISVHCRLGKKPIIPSNEEISTVDVKVNADIRLSITKPKTPGEEESKMMRRRYKTSAEKFREAAVQAVSMFTGKRLEFQKKVMPCYVVPGFGYLLFQTFNNPEDFDLMKVRREEIFRIEDEMRTALVKARASSPARKLKKHQSPQRIRELQKRKGRREKEKDERRQKILEKTTHAVERLLKVKTSVTNIPVLNVHCTLTANEVDLAILQLLNREYFQQLEMQALEELLEKEDRALFDADSHDEDFQINLLPGEASIPGLNQPLKRLKGGTWVSADDFPYAFHELIIYHSPAAFQYRVEMIDVWQEAGNAYVPNEKFEVWVVKRESGAPRTADFLLGFAPMLPSSLDFQPESISVLLQRYDFATETVEDWPPETKIVTSSIKVARISFPLSDETLTLRPYCNCTPCGCSLFLCSNIPVQTMSKVDYLLSSGWNSMVINIEYPPMCKGMYYILAKIDLKVTTNGPFFFKISGSQPALLSSLRLFIVNRDQERDNLESGVQLTLNLPTLSTKRLQLEPNNNGYYLVFDGSSMVNTPEGSFALECIQKEAGTVAWELVELMDPVEFSDVYQVNKYGNILKEHLFVGSDTPVSIHVRLRRGGMPVPSQVKGKEVVFAEELQVPEMHIIVMELYEGDQLRLKTKGRNQAHFGHIRLAANVQYLLVCYYDLRDWPEAATGNPENEGVNWAVRVFACDTVVLVRDTRKEDKEDSIRKGWEATQPGRSELAKSSRARFLIQQKSLQGEPLTDAEKAVIKDSWEDRRKARKDAEINPKAKGKPPAKDDKKAKEALQAQENAAIATTIEVPRPENHMMREIKQFLTHIHSPRLVVNNTEFVGKNHLSATQLEEIKQKNLEEVKTWGEKMEIRKTDRENNQGALARVLQASKNALEEDKSYTESLISAYKTAREEYKTAFEQTREATLKLKTALLTPEIGGLNEALEVASAANCDRELIRGGRGKLVEMVVTEVNAKLKTGIEGKDGNAIGVALQMMEKYGVEEDIDQRIVRKARRILNP